MPLILSRYIANRFLMWFAIFFGGLSLVVLVANLLELLRRASSRPAVGFDTVLQLALLQLPNTAQQLLPFAVLFSAIMAFWRLTRSNELVVARSVGVGVWQFIMPVILAALLIGGAKLAVFNTFSALTFARFERVEAQALKGQADTLAVSEGGLWLRQATSDGPAILHARAISPDLTTLSEVMVLQYDAQDRFVARIDAARAVLEAGAWRIEDAARAPNGKPAQPVGTIMLSTDLTPQRIQDSFARPETLSFWTLPAYIDSLRKAGFSAVRPRLYFQSQIAAPLLLAAMVLIAASFSLRQTRRGGVGRMIGLGVVAGFLFYFMSDLVYALGLSARLPVELAAWAPVGIVTMLGASMLLHLEDG